MAVVPPDRGDLLWLSVDPTAGHEQAGHRPAAVLSQRAYNSRSGLAVVVPVTTRPKGRPFEVPLPDGLRVRGVALADQVRSIDWSARVVQLADRLPPESGALVRGTARRLLE